MIKLQHTIVLVLRSGKDFSFRDVELIARHINGKWNSKIRPRIICLWDNASTSYNLGNIEIIPLINDYPGTWSRMQCYSPEMEKYKPFLYVDLDTAVIASLENIFKLIYDPTQLIVLEDFWQKDQLATGLVWFPANSSIVNKVWKEWNKSKQVFSSRMDPFLRSVIGKKAIYWQQLTDTVFDFKPKETGVLAKVPDNANLVCFHGKPRIYDAAESSMSLPWVTRYVSQDYFPKVVEKKAVTVIIPYNKDRGWLLDAIASVPKDVQLLVSQGNGNWPSNFNKALPEATGDYIKYLHEDDMLTENCIEDSVRAMQEQDADFIHGCAMEIVQQSGKKYYVRPSVEFPTFSDLLKKNTLHSASLMYKREIFEAIGGFDETLNASEEYEFNLRCLKAGYKIGFCPTVLAIYRRHQEQKVVSLSKKLQEAERKLIKDKYRV